MPALFVSHASKDDAVASALEAWLLANGFTDLFVDHHSIPGGDRWRYELRASAGACRAVVCLVTQSWLDSHECFAEFRAISGYWGKRTIPLSIRDVQARRSRRTTAFSHGSCRPPRSFPETYSASGDIDAQLCRRLGRTLIRHPLWADGRSRRALLVGPLAVA
jgi:hypothetical protein